MSSKNAFQLENDAKLITNLNGMVPFRSLGTIPITAVLSLIWL